jgi:hypothetical protein
VRSIELRAGEAQRAWLPLREVTDAAIPAPVRRIVDLVNAQSRSDE